MHRRRTISIALALVMVQAGCANGQSPAPARAPAGHAFRVLFVGNSLTYTNDLPAQVAALARATGHALTYRSVAAPNFSLEDHMGSGLAGVIAEEAADVVVLQQGPSSLPESRAHLVRWSGRIGALVRAAGGRPALLMVWPPESRVPESRVEAFSKVHDSYAAAALAADGLFIPAGMTWQAARRRDSTLVLHGSDGFHPGALGTLATAITIHAVLFAPGTAAFTCPPLPADQVRPEVLQLLCDSARESLAPHGSTH